MRYLAGAAHNEAAFRWLWALMRGRSNDDGYWLELNRNLIEGTKVPEDLAGEVQDFVLSPVPEAQASSYQRASMHRKPRETAQHLLLARLDKTSAVARSVARAVLHEEAHVLPEVREAAFEILGASEEYADREVLRERAEHYGAKERIQPLLSLSPPHDPQEQAMIAETLEQVIPEIEHAHPGSTSVSRETYRADVGQLASRLNTKQLARLLSGSWARQQEARSRFLDSLVPHLGLDDLEGLLKEDLVEDVRRTLIDVISRHLSLDQLTEFGRWAYSSEDPSSLAPVRARVADYADQSRFGSQGRREVALAALRDFALACDDEEAAADYAIRLQSGELPNIPKRSVSSVAKRRRFGRVAAKLLKRDYEAFLEDVEAVADQFDKDEELASFLSGLVEVTEGELNVDFLGPAVLGRPKSIVVLADAGNGWSVVRAAVEGRNRKADSLIIAEAAIGRLDDHSSGYLMSTLNWVQLDVDEYQRFVSALRRDPQALFAVVEEALRSLAGPEADMIPLSHLEALLRAALNSRPDELNRRLGGTPTAHLQQLFDSSSRPLHELGREWATLLEPNDDLVHFIVRTDESMVGFEDEFAGVRKTYAEKLVKQARDPSKNWDERGSALLLAMKADQQLAREAAMILCGYGAVGFRRTTAQVLAKTQGRPGDEERLELLLQEEPETHVREQLADAKRRITSSSVEIAIENLHGLLGLDDTRGVSPQTDILLPYEDWHETFIENVDKARQRAGGEPGAYVDALITLSELLVEQAVIARFDADPKNGSVKPPEVELLRINRPNKPDVGSLIVRQRAQQIFPWFPEVIVLRRLRGAHPAPSGTTRPLSITAETVVEANKLFESIILGWEESMVEASVIASTHSK